MPFHNVRQIDLPEQGKKIFFFFLQLLPGQQHRFLWTRSPQKFFGKVLKITGWLKISLFRATMHKGKKPVFITFFRNWEAKKPLKWPVFVQLCTKFVSAEQKFICYNPYAVKVRGLMRTPHSWLSASKKFASFIIKAWQTSAELAQFLILTKQSRRTETDISPSPGFPRRRLFI